MTSAPIRILVADDQELIREALVTILGRVDQFVVVGTARDGHDALVAAQRLQPDVILLDMRMPGLTGDAVTARIKGDPDLATCRVLILSTFEDDDAIRSCIGAGADGFVGKGTSAAALADAIRSAHAGGTPLSERARRTLRTAPAGDASGADQAADSVARLSARELEIFALAGGGAGNDEIGRALSISPHTVKTHVRNIMHKLDIHARAGIVVIAHRLGIAERHG